MASPWRVWNLACTVSARSLVLFVLALVLTLVAVHAATAAPKPSTPLPPLQAWEVAADGTVYVLDAAQRVYALDPATLAVVAVSPRLATTAGGSGAQIASDDRQVFMIGDQFPGVLILDRQTLIPTATLDLTAAAIAVEPGHRLFYVEQSPLEQLPTLSRFQVKSLPLDDLAATPQAWDITASQPYASLIDLAVDPVLGRLYVGVHDTGGSAPRHFTHYRAFDLDTGAEIDLPVRPQSTSTMGRPVFTPAGATAISFAWQGVYPEQHRIIVQDSDGITQTVEGLAGPLVLDPAGAWLYVVQPHGLWALEATAGGTADGSRADGFALRAVLPFVATPPAVVRIAPDGATLYLFGNGWLSALATAELQAGGIEPVAPFPSAWASDAHTGQPNLRLFQAADAGPVALAALSGGAEWYRTADAGQSWQLLANVQYPTDLGLDRLSLSPTMADDGTLAARGGWRNDGTRQVYNSADAGVTWSPWAPPIAFAGGTGPRAGIYVATLTGDTLAGAGETGAYDTGAEAQLVIADPTAENPAFAPGWTHLVYQSRATGNWELYRVPVSCTAVPATREDRCRPVQLTGSPGDDLLPAWSPDGRTIAFVSTRDGNPEIYVMRSDGATPTRVTYNDSGDWRPAWLPDSRHLVFTSDRAGNNDIYLAENPLPYGDRGGEGTIIPVVVSVADERDAAVNGDGQLVFLSTWEGNAQPFTVDLTPFLEVGSHTPAVGRRVLDAGDDTIAHPGWLPDGRLIFAVDDTIFAAPPNAHRGQFQVLTTGPQTRHPTGGPAWAWPQPVRTVELAP